MASKTILHEIYRLHRTIHRFSANQAKIIAESEKLDKVEVEIYPSGGYYYGGKFVFEINVNENFPKKPPSVLCRTPIHHPNIDMTEDSGCGYPVCLNILQDNGWSDKYGLDDVVQGLLYLLHNPNRADPLNPFFLTDITEEQFASDVRKSLMGGLVEYFEFERNYEIPDTEPACLNINNSNNSFIDGQKSPEKTYTDQYTVTKYDIVTGELSENTNIISIEDIINTYDIIEEYDLIKEEKCK